MHNLTIAFINNFVSTEDRLQILLQLGLNIIGIIDADNFLDEFSLCSIQWCLIRLYHAFVRGVTMKMRILIIKWVQFMIKSQPMHTSWDRNLASILSSYCNKLNDREVIKTVQGYPFFIRFPSTRTIIDVVNLWHSITTMITRLPCHNAVRGMIGSPFSQRSSSSKPRPTHGI